MNPISALRRFLGPSSRSIEAGGHGPRWTPGKAIRSPAREITIRRQLAAERALWLAQNDPTAAAIVSAWTGNIVADGPAIAAKTTDDALRTALAERFDAWWSRCDAEGIDDLAGMLHRLVRGVVTTGEAFVIMETDEAGELRLRTIDPTQCDATLTRSLADGRRIVAGIEMDERGRRLAYWIRDAEERLTAYSATPRRVDARDVLHLFDRQHPGQQRGLSWLAPVATLIDQLGELGDTTLALLNTSALYGAVLTNANGDAPGGQEGPDPTLEPGSIIRAPVGWDVKFSDPPTMTGIDAYRREMLHTIAAGAGVPFELISANLSEVNFSSARVGLHEFRRRVDTLRRTLLTARFLDPIWRRWLAHEALHGRVSPAIAANLEMTAAWPGWPAIDPLKDAQADQIAIAIGVESRHAVIARRGRDPREVDAEIAADTFVPRAAPAAKSEDKPE
ncbi:phage portal protein [Ancylobacter sp. SL191]|uniref:phage portal protein n=1 Tax=Ancylobacter sp. SL191 TaxID=2995166 RepID=UPI00226FF575|nr:phage portal protein [Ancylobacter sp. SL191]WAC26268.1 phage portal protein [Ancylobacter sp. SL191]